MQADWYEGCPPDEDEIKNYISRQDGYTLIPFVGPALAQAYVKPPENKAAKALGTKQGNLDAQTEKLRENITKVAVENRSLIQDTVTSLKNYSDALLNLTSETLTEEIMINTAGLVALAIVIIIIIFLGI